MISTALAKRIKLVGLDVDGVLTDGGLYIGDVGGMPQELKRYDIQDGLGIRFLRASGIKVVIITGRVSESVRLRAAELEVDDLIQDHAGAQAPRATAPARALRTSRPRKPRSWAMTSPIIPCCASSDFPLPSRTRCRRYAHCAACQLTRTGGNAAVREFAEMLLKARGDWERVVSDYLVERIDTKLEVLR